MDKRIRNLFERYQAGTATVQERMLVESWFDSHKQEPGTILGRKEESAVFEDLDARIAHLLNASDGLQKRDFRWLRIAAIFLAVMGSGLFIRRTIVKRAAKPETYTELKSLNGVKKEVTLKDGTTVFLNSGSSVFVSSRYGERNREVKLSGEAFFEVHHNAAKPFIIHSGKLQTTVLGTSFDIKAYPEDERVKVTVATGKVKVEAVDPSGKPTLFAKALVRNQALVYNKIKDSHRVTYANADSVSSWRTNHLIFDNASYEEIAGTLGHWYGLDITLSKDSHDAKRYTLSFYNEPVDKVLNVLSSLTGMTYSMNGRKIIINPKNQFQ